MANYFGVARTNYFRVTDENGFREMMKRVKGSEDDIEVFEREIDGVQHFGFGCYSSILGLSDNEDEDGDGDSDAMYSNFVTALQQLLHPEDAVIMFEIGYEKLRYLVGHAHVIAQKNEASVDLISTAVKKAKELLGNPDYEPTCDY